MKKTYSTVNASSFIILVFLLLSSGIYAYSPLTQKIQNGGKVFKSIESDAVETLIPGVTKTSVAYTSLLDEPVKLWIIEADLSLPNLSVESIIPDNDRTVNETTGYKGQDVLGMALAADAQGHHIISAINGGFFVTPNQSITESRPAYQARGPLHINGVIIPTVTSGNTSTIMGVKNNGDMFLYPVAAYETYKKDIKECSGGSVVLVDNGVKKTYTYQSAINREPRTGMGYIGSKLYIIVADGRRTGYSLGLNYEQMSDIFMALGTENAINLDGGGSTMLAARNKVSGTIETVNMPSDTEKGKPETSVPRPVSNGFAIVARSLTPDNAAIKPMWNTSLIGGNGSSAPAQSLDRKAIYVASGALNGGEAKVYAFDVTNGQSAWSKPFDLQQDGAAVQTSLGAVDASIITAPTGEIYATYGCKGSAPGYVYAISPDGTKKGSHKVNNNVSSNFFQSPPALLPDGNIVITHRGTAGGVRIINKTDFSQKSYLGEGYSSSNLVTTRDNMIYVHGVKGIHGIQVGDDGTMQLINKYSFSDNCIGGYGLAVDNAGKVFGAGGAAGAARIYAVSNGCNTLLWEYPTTKNMAEKIEQGGIALGENDRLYATTDANKTLIALDKNSGSEKWCYTADAPISCTPAIDNQGYIHVGDMAGNYIILKDNDNTYQEIFKDKLYRNGAPSTALFSSPLIGENGTVYVSAYVGSAATSSLFAISVNGTTEAANSSWPMKGGNAFRTGLQASASSGTMTTTKFLGSDEFSTSTIQGGIRVHSQKEGELTISNHTGTIIIQLCVQVGENDIRLDHGFYILSLNGKKGVKVIF